MVNDYLQFDEDNQLHRDAAQWLFLEEYDPVLDGKAVDVVGFHVVMEAFQLDVDRFRFEVQQLRDRIKNLPKGERDPRGKKKGFLGGEGLRCLVEGCKKTDYHGRIFFIDRGKLGNS